MPIRPEMRDKYPANWQEIRARILKRADHKCEWCGVKNYWLGGRSPSGQFHAAIYLGCNKKLPRPGEYAWCEGWNEKLRIVRIVLTIAHIHDHDPENCADDNLAALCQRCHNAHDAPMRRKGIFERERKLFAIGDLFAANKEV